MVQQDSQRDPPSHQFILSPNCSLTWREAKRVLAAVAVVELIIGGAFLWAGLPLVLPFSGLEILVLWFVFHHCLVQGSRREIVVVDNSRVVVQRGRHHPTEEQEFQRAWVRVILDPGGGWYPNRLKLRSHGRELEIGEFLTEEERESLARQLGAAVGRRV